MMKQENQTSGMELAKLHEQITQYEGPSYFKKLLNMVLILDDNLEIGALTISNCCCFICLMHLIRLESSQKLDFFSPKRHIFPHVGAICSELPSNISAKPLRNTNLHRTVCLLISVKFISSLYYHSRFIQLPCWWKDGITYRWKKDEEGKHTNIWPTNTVR